MIAELTLRPNEHWWGGAVADGQAMPFGATAIRRDLATSAGFLHDDTAGANQSAPLLVSDAGRYVWSERPFTFAFDGTGGLVITGDDPVVGEPGGDLRSAFRAAADTHFPASGATPGRAMFTGPQANTWIELPYHPTQAGVIDYARTMIDSGLPPGVVMIDDGWPVDYGVWTFDPAAFPDPAAMCAELHELGCAVVLWLVPFVSPDSEVFRELDRRGLLITGPDGRPVINEWWNGFSAILDLTHPDAVAWLRDVLDDLVALGVDGFKFDAGDLRDHRRSGDVSFGGGGAVDQCEAWARFAEGYAYNELRACWKRGGRPLAQRLHDKPPRWGAGGLDSLIPEGIAQGLIGHAFNCPDMIGGGDLAEFADGAEVDQELFVRFAQASVLFPMVQFSLNPQRVLDPAPLAAVQAAVALRQRLLPELLTWIDHAAATGEPVLRPLAYHHDGYAEVSDQFLVGDALLVAPVLERGATHRTVRVPPGHWQDGSGAVVIGPAVVELTVTLDTLPWWRRVG